MNVLALLIFVSLAVATLFLVAFIWSVRSGQYEDTATPSLRVLMEDGPGARPVGRRDAGGERAGPDRTPGSAAEESRPT